jgi:multicomponent Na+:H+ antiporter subunit D
MIELILIPFGGALMALLLGGRGKLFVGVATALAASWFTAKLMFAGTAHYPMAYPMGGWAAPLGIELRLDGFSLAMLLLASIVCLFATVYAAAYFRSERTDSTAAVFFWPLWLLQWGGLNAVFLAGDLFNTYLALEFTILSAAALIVVQGRLDAIRGALTYVLASLAGSLTFLMGVGFVYAITGSLNSSAAALGENAAAQWAGVLLLGGLLVKSALFPFHFWLPEAHAKAPAPVSAVLSAVVVKAGFYVALRLWLDLFPGDLRRNAGPMVGTLGTMAILLGSIWALQQTRLKLLVAYSTVAQVGFLFLFFAMLQRPEGEAWKGVVYQALAHGLAKASMFMFAGAVQVGAGTDQLKRASAWNLPVGTAAFVISGVILAGLYPGGGPKGLLLKAAWELGEWWWMPGVILGMALTTAYLGRALYFLWRNEPAQKRTISRWMEWSALGLAGSAVGLAWNSEALIEWLLGP